MEYRSFEQIYLQYYKPVYAYLMTLCQNEELAAELTQETFYKALDAIDGFKGGCALNVWLCQIAKNTLTDTYLRQKRELPPLDDTLTDVPSPAPLPGEELEQREGALSLYQKLHALPEPYREVVWLRVYGELTFAEIAALHHKTESWARVTFLGISTSTITYWSPRPRPFRYWMPWPRRRNLVPLWVPSVICCTMRPSTVGTSTSSPSTAWLKVMGTWMVTSYPSRSNIGSALTVTCTITSPAGPP